MPSSKVENANLHADVLIVGAGITGLSTALALAESGMKVTVIERYRPAAMASGWTLAGVRQSGRDPAELALARRAVTLWQSLDDHLDASTGYRQTGNLRLARSEAEATVIRQLVEDQQQAGLDITLLDAAALQEQAPALSRELVCASLCLSDGQADPLATSHAYRTAAERLGVTFLTGTSVHRVNTQAGRFLSLQTDAGTLQADTCILATGIQTNDLLRSLDVSLPIRWAMVSVIQSKPLPALLTPVVGVANADLALRQQADGRMRMSSGAEFVGTEFNNSLLVEKDGMPQVPTTPVSIQATLTRITKVLPAIADTPVERHWGGLLDMTPDALPVIDFIPGSQGLIVAAGFSGHGFGIGPAVGETIAELALHGKTSLPVGAFAFDRFEQFVSPEPALHG